MKRAFRIISSLVIMAVLFTALGMAMPVQAAAGTPYFEVISVKVDESVTIRAYNFPANKLFTIRMDVVGNYALNGFVVTQTNTGAGGSFQETYAIPAELRGKTQIGMRMDADGGYYAYNWFSNRTASGTQVPVTGSQPPATTSATVSPSIRIIGVQEDKTVTLLARRFPAATYFTVRIGPFYNFWKGHQVVGDIYSGNGGDFEITLNLPDVVDNVDLVTVRMDSSNGYYAYNAFWNTSSWTTPGSTTGVPVTGSGYSCSITASTPNSTLTKKADFDGTWTIKNTGTKTWDMDSVDYKYVSGTNMDKNGERFDLSKTVKPGESIKIVVDMIAPNSVGNYSTNWALVSGSTTLCNLPLTIYVR